MTKDNNIAALNDFIVSNGEEITDVNAISSDEFINKTEQLLPYETNDNAEFLNADAVTYTREQAEQHLRNQAAFNKLQKENEYYQSLSDNEKIHQYVSQVEYYRNTNQFFQQYGYEMSGKQKRALKRTIERNWKLNKYKLTEEQKQDILFEMNKASNITPNQPANTDKAVDLNSLISRV